MPNFHDNHFIVAADEENMCKVLWRMAMNLAANNEDTYFSMDELDGVTTARDIYCQVAPFIDTSYEFAFAGAPVPDKVAKGNILGWTSPTSSEGGYMAQLATMAKVTEQFSANAPEGLRISLSVAPTGRAMSDTAGVDLTKYGKNWVLAVKYETAWRPNSEDLDIFFMGLPEGNYGVAFLDADEYDNFSLANMINGLHHGLARMQSFDGEGYCGLLDSADLKAQRREYVGMAKSDIDDIAELARVAAISGWNQLSLNGEDGGYEDSFVGDDGESVDYFCRPLFREPLVNWRNPSEREINTVVSVAACVVAALPYSWSLGYGWTKEGNEAVEKMLPGDEVMVTSEWSDSSFTSLKVSTVDNIQIGIGNEHMFIARGASIDDYGRYITSCDIDEIALGVLALMLPHIKATICDLTPVSLRNTGVEGPKMSVRFDALRLDFASVMDEIRESLKKECSERTLTSNVERGV